MSDTAESVLLDLYLTPAAAMPLRDAVKAAVAAAVKAAVAEAPAVATLAKISRAVSDMSEQQRRADKDRDRARDKAAAAAGEADLERIVRYRADEAKAASTASAAGEVLTALQAQAPGLRGEVGALLERNCAAAFHRLREEARAAAAEQRAKLLRECEGPLVACATAASYSRQFDVCNDEILSQGQGFLTGLQAELLRELTGAAPRPPRQPAGVAS
jgi:hypothetical protein